MELSERELAGSSLSWRSILAGTLISLLCYAILMSLGLAIGSGQLKDVIRGEGAGGLGIGSAIWLIASVLISLFVGGYFGGRAAGWITTRNGVTTGMVIAALFFGVMLTGAGNLVGFVGKGIGSTVGAIGDTAGNIARNPEIQDTVNRALQGNQLKAPVNEVVQGIAVRLIQGDTEGAKSYLVSQSNLTEAEADRVISDVEQNIGPTLERVGTTGATVLSAVGWTLFFSLVLGTLCASLGGATGAKSRLSKPISARDRERLSRPAA